MSHWFYLGIAILSEIAGTTALKFTEGYTRPGPTAVVVIAYGVAFYFLSLTLRTLPVGIAYAVWSGVGMALIALIGWVFLKQPLDAPAIAGIALIVAGAVLLGGFSKSMVH
ncbi:MAG: multidrug efflux SMR transporter [Steroidobacteraceae bacterium]